MHQWDQIHRVDGKTRGGLERARVGPWGWAVDMATTADNRLLAVGRYNWKFDFTPDAWSKESALENPNAFLRFYSPDFDLLFSASLPGVVPFETARIGPDRFAVVGRAEKGAAAVQDAMLAKSPGKSDGYLLIVECKNPKKPNDGARSGRNPTAPRLRVRGFG